MRRTWSVLAVHIGLLCQGVLAADAPVVTADTQVQRGVDTALWAFRVPKDGPVLYRGVANFDAAGSGPGGMMYPAPNAVGLIAAIITHAVIAESAKNSEKAKIQDDADKILLPYRALLDTHTNRELLTQAVSLVRTPGDKLIFEASDQPTGAWIVEASPTFFMVQDESAFVLQNVIAMYSPKDSATPTYRAEITVVSLPRPGGDHRSFWTAASGEKLKHESAHLVAQSLDIALKEATGAFAPTAAVHKTFRYQEGSIEKIERGELVSAQCDRVVIRTLRGGLMSVPTRQTTQPSSARPCSE